MAYQPAFVALLAVAKRKSVRMQQRMVFLAQTGLVLDRSLDFDDTLRRLADLTVPELAQLTVIDLLDGEDSIGAAVAAAPDPQHARAGRGDAADSPARFGERAPCGGRVAQRPTRSAGVDDPGFSARDRPGHRRSTTSASSKPRANLPAPCRRASFLARLPEIPGVRITGRYRAAAQRPDRSSRSGTDPVRARCRSSAPQWLRDGPGGAAGVP